MKTPPTQFETALRTLVFGLTAYLITYAIFTLAQSEFLIPDIKKDAAFIADRRYIMPFATACAVSFICAVLWLYVYTYRWFGRFLRFIDATKKTGDEDIWDYAFNTSDPAVEYVHVRDYANNKILPAGDRFLRERQGSRAFASRRAGLYSGFRTTI